VAEGIQEYAEVKTQTLREQAMPPGGYRSDSAVAMQGNPHWAPAPALSTSFRQISNRCIRFLSVPSAVILPKSSPCLTWF